MTLRITRPGTLRGTLHVPPDKSLTHRAYMLGAIADGDSFVRNPLRAEDTDATKRCLEHMGLRCEPANGGFRLIPAADWMAPRIPLDCGNSGTTMRLLSGLIASRPFSATLTGDDSLSRRPMGRIAAPLRLMGAEVEGETPPLTIRGGALRGIDYESPVASAQVKSCLLFAGLRAEGETWVREPSPSRDHTERMLETTGVPILREGGRVGVRGGSQPSGFIFHVPGDFSSAAFFLAAAAMVPESEIVLSSVGVNPTRTGMLDVLRACGARVIEEVAHNELGEPIADLQVRARDGLRAFTVEGALVPRLIDELPVLAVLATQCAGETVIRDAGELRHKESDRIETVVQALRAMGAKVESRPDGMAIEGPTPLRGAEIDAKGDHRIAMAFAVAGLVADGETILHGAESIATSYPDFVPDLEALRVD